MLPILTWMLLIVPIVLATCPTDTACDKDLNRCYKFVFGKNDFFAAEDICQAQGGHLVAIRNGFEKGMVDDIAQSMFAGVFDYWIGGNHLLASQWTWTDGSPWNYTNWYPGQPQVQQVVSAVLGNGLWMSVSEIVMKPFVCGLPYIPANSLQMTCEDGWTRFGSTNACYKLVRNLTFDSAEAHCKSLEAHLASVHSKEENDFIINIASTGITMDFSGETWIGLYKKTKDFQWTDSSKVDFTVWAEGEPNNQDGNEACVMLYTDNVNFPTIKLPYYKMWDDYNCDKSLRAAICKKPAM